MNGKLSSETLRAHFLGTYWGLRAGLFLGAAVLPLLLWWGGELRGTALLSSMSAYYHSDMRDFFVGSLFAVGGLLITYRGFSREENWALNLACAFLLGVALIPTGSPASDPAALERGWSAFVGFFSLHGTCAVLFFLCLAYVCLFRAGDTLSLIRPDPSRPWHRSAEGYQALYRVIGVLLILSPLGAAAVAFLVRTRSGQQTFTFWAEAFAVWTFAVFWLIKSREVQQTNAEQLATGGSVARSGRSSLARGRVVQVEPDDWTPQSDRERQSLLDWMELPKTGRLRGIAPGPQSEENRRGETQ
ncbi:MAG: hypothetical protein OEN56_10235 [Gemmatimonadota bacterium]|nr:hypothetical protein [Gemmatimonadota bacterium]